MTSVTCSLPVLVIACGALAKELISLVRANRWEHIQLTCLPARLHNRPERIPEAVRKCIQTHRPSFSQIFVAYGDCGTGGRLDRVLEEEGVERIPGAHCYEFLTGSAEFSQLAEAEPGTFFLTDFLARHFDRLVIHGLGLDQHPELLPLYFGNYQKVLYLAQRRDSSLMGKARAAAERLGLQFEVRYTGLQPLQEVLLQVAVRSEPYGEVNYSVLA
jgi:hypothetical protein